MPTDNGSTLVNETIERSRFFQTIQSWPLSDELNYEGWLRNFSSIYEKELACHLLSFFTYYSSKMIDKMLSVSVGNAGRLLEKKIPNWKHSNFKDICLYSFIPGENPNPTDSGNYFARKLRDSLGIREENIIDYYKIPLAANPSQPIILVDDFVGSGAQVYKAWNENTMPVVNMTLAEMTHKLGITIIYAPLIVNLTGYNLIANDCPGLQLSPCHILSEEYNLFNPKCYCWRDDLQLYKDGTNLILHKSQELGIPFSEGRSTQDVRGFNQQGLAISFEHGAPDAIIPLLYWCDNSWTPLLKKNYQR